MDVEEFKLSLCAFIGKSLVWVNNALRINVADDVDFHFEYVESSHEVYMHSIVTHISRSRAEAYALELLQANLFGQDTGGSAVVAYDPDEGAIVLWDKLHLDGLSNETFWERFSYMYLSRMHWAVRLDSDRRNDRSTKLISRFRS